MPMSKRVGQGSACFRSAKTAVILGTTKVIKTDIKASNGVIHVINKVLIPSGLKLN